MSSVKNPNTSLTLKYILADNNCLKPCCGEVNLLCLQESQFKPYVAAVNCDLFNNILTVSHNFLLRKVLLKCDSVFQPETISLTFMAND